MNVSSPEVTRLLKVGAVVLAILAAFLALEVALAVKDLGVPSQGYNSITVPGTGDATSTPDIATFSFSVTADATQSTDAQSQVNAKMATITADLKAQNIADADIQTADYSLNPKYIYQNSVCTGGTCPPSRQIPDGYTASQSVTVKVRNMSNASAVIALVGTNGATNISGLSFTLDDPNAPQDLAHARAIDDAKAHAAILAQQLGVSLGKVISYQDNSSGGVVYPVYSMGKTASMDAAVAPMPVLPSGENKVTANVSVTYEIR